MTASPIKGDLFIVGTPIGNMEDITLRAIRTLGEADIIAAEDTRVTAKLCKRHGIGTPITSFREQNARTAIPKLVDALLSGKNVALVTDAGTPSVSDPGVTLVEAARKVGILIVPIPGPSALATAISVAGLPGDGVRFLGFLPRRGKVRASKIESIASERALVVLYEAPNRLKQTLVDLEKVCGTRQAVVCREMTKLHEEIAFGTLDELANKFEGQVKGEVTIAVEGHASNDEEISEDRLRDLVRGEIAKGRSAKDISTSLAGGLGLSRKKIYDITVEELKRT